MSYEFPTCERRFNSVEVEVVDLSGVEFEHGTGFFEFFILLPLGLFVVLPAALFFLVFGGFLHLNTEE